MVRSEYDELFEGDVSEVHVVYKTDSLDDLVKDYDSGLRDLEDLIDDYASQLSRNKKVKRKQVNPPPPSFLDISPCRCCCIFECNALSDMHPPSRSIRSPSFGVTLAHRAS